MSVLSYQTPRKYRPIAAVVLLWLWAIADVGFGLLLMFVSLVLSEDHSAWGPVFFLAGVLIAGWGLYTATLAVAVFRRLDMAAERAFRACNRIAKVWFVGYFAWTGGVGVIWIGFGDNISAALIWLIPHSLIFAGILATLDVLSNARNQERLERLADAVPPAE